MPRQYFWFAFLLCDLELFAWELDLFNPQLKAKVAFHNFTFHILFILIRQRGTSSAEI